LYSRAGRRQEFQPEFSAISIPRGMSCCCCGLIAPISSKNPSKADGVNDAHEPEKALDMGGHPCEYGSPYYENYD
jgi:hypothetical protein